MISGDEKVKKEDAYKSLDLVNIWIGNVDTKISYSLTFIGVLVGFFLTSRKPIYIKELLNSLIKNGIFKSGNIVSIIILILIITFAICSSISIIILYKALTAKVNPKEFEDRGLVTQNSVIFWGAISNKAFRDFNREVTNMTDQDRLKEINSQVYINSKICNEKFKLYNKGIIFIKISVFVFFIYKGMGCLL